MRRKTFYSRIKKYKCVKNLIYRRGVYLVSLNKGYHLNASENLVCHSQKELLEELEKVQYQGIFSRLRTKSEKRLMNWRDEFFRLTNLIKK